MASSKGLRGVCGGSALVAMLLGGCGPQTSRIADGVTTQSLAANKKSVAVMRIGAASPVCDHVAVLLGTRAGEAYRGNRWIIVAHVRSVAEPAVAEVELDPGEHHILTYLCRDGKKLHGVGDAAAEVQLHRSSLAAFRVEPGEIVNVGYFHIHVARIGTNAFGRPLTSDVAVTDWPLAELDRYKAKRPAVYAQMVTRLMAAVDHRPAPPTADECLRLARLKAEQKIASVPASCGQSAAIAQPPRRMP